MAVFRMAALIRWRLLGRRPLCASPMLRFSLYLARLLAALIVLVGPVHADDTPAEPGVRGVTVGVYLSSVHGLDFARETFRATFWLWATHNDPAFRPAVDLEIVNAQTMQVEREYREILPSGRITVS